MEKITKENFEKWVQKNNWLRLNEISTANGRQMTFLTPSGSLIIAIYDLNGNLFQIAMLGPAPQQNQPTFPLGFPKGPSFLGKG